MSSEVRADWLPEGERRAATTPSGLQYWLVGGHRHREMTAADLGLPKPFVIGQEYLIWKHHETGELLGTSVGPEAYRARCVRAIRTAAGWAEIDAPYSFWLGADADKPIDLRDPRWELRQPDFKASC